MPSYQNYRLWKWKELSHRRVFFLALLQFILAFLWLNLYLTIGDSHYFSDHDQEALHPLPLVVCFFHVFNFLLITLTEKGRNMVREAQGKYACYWSAASLVLNELFLILTFYYSITDKLSTQSAVLFVVVSLVGIQMFSHLGASYAFMAIFKVQLVIWWIFFLVVLDVTYPALIVLLGCFITFHSFGVLTENEFYAAFQRLKSTTMSTEELVEDTVYAAEMIDEAISRCRMVVHPQLRAKLKLTLKQQHIDPESSIIAFTKRGSVQELHRWPVENQKLAILAESDYLCHALSYALKDDLDILPRIKNDEKQPNVPVFSQFMFLEACNTVISMLEHAVGHGLPFYVDDNAQKVSITGPQAILEVILLLLLYDCAHNSPGISILSCDSNAGEGWKLKVQTTILYQRRSNNSMMNAGGSSVDGREGSSNQLVQRRAPRFITKSFLSTKSFLDAQSTEKRSCLERLADHISRKAFQEPVLETEPEYREGYKISYRSVVLKNDVFSCSVVNTNGVTGGHPIHSTMAAIRSTSRGGVNVRPSPRKEVNANISTNDTVDETAHLIIEEGIEDIGGGSYSSSRSFREDGQINNTASTVLYGNAAGNHSLRRAGIDSTDRATPSQELLTVIDSWIFLVPRLQDANDLTDIKGKINVLAIPTAGNFSVAELAKQSYVYSCAIISENYLKALAKSQHNVIFHRVKQLIVAYDRTDNSAGYFHFEYGIRISFALPLHGSSLKQVFDCVQGVTKRQDPRVKSGTEPQRTDVKYYVVQWIALLHQLKDVEKIAQTSGYEHELLHTLINQVQDLLPELHLSTAYSSIIALAPELLVPWRSSRVVESGAPVGSYAKNGKGYLRSMDNLLSRMRKSLDDGDAQKLEGFVKEALKLTPDMQPITMFLKTIQDVMRICLGTVAPLDEVNSEVRPFTRPMSMAQQEHFTSLVEIGEPMVKDIVRQMLDLLDGCIWEVVLNKD